MYTKLFYKALVIGCICFHAGLHAMQNEQFPWTPPKNFILQPSYIALHHPVSTKNVLGQLYFDQGLTFIYAFNHDAAYWSFFRASEADPEMAMAYWGMALAIGANINMPITHEREKAAHAFIEKAIQKAANGPEVEKDYIQALAIRYLATEDLDEKKVAADYSQAMSELTVKYKDDPDAAVLYAESLLDVNPWDQWSKDGKPQPDTLQAIGVLGSVLARRPDHLGANHYYVHLVEASPYPELALMSAERLKTLLPSSGHILHMPSHIYTLVGDYEQAARSNQAAVAADREYIRQYGMDGIYPLHYLSHNLFFLSRAYTLEGRFNDALNTANELVDFYGPSFQKVPELEYYISTPLTVLITFHRWKEILEMPKPNENMKVITALWHFGRALAYAQLGKIEESRKEQELFVNSRNQLGETTAFGSNQASQIMNIADNYLAAAIARSQGDFHQAEKALKIAVAIQDNLRYNEPPDWFFPLRETLGALYLSMQQPAQAEEVLRIELRRHPKNGRALFALSESLRRQTKEVDAYWVDQEFQKAWKNSTIQLTIDGL